MTDLRLLPTLPAPVPVSLPLPASTRPAPPAAAPDRRPSAPVAPAGPAGSAAAGGHCRFAAYYEE
ncbi:MULTISPECIES: hypothetical protein [Kitasatospora]|uniref:hypothetical protein n=1 Tax=Kitasatospora TaxID=2063 RepID=UPI0002F08C26|nr:MULTISPECIES: hypothetical protein [Kitasatospora]